MGRNNSLHEIMYFYNSDKVTQPNYLPPPPQKKMFPKNQFEKWLSLFLLPKLYNL